MARDEVTAVPMAADRHDCNGCEGCGGGGGKHGGISAHGGGSHGGGGGRGSSALSGSSTHAGGGKKDGGKKCGGDSAHGSGGGGHEPLRWTKRWGSRKQTCIAPNSTEPEFVADAESCQQLLWIDRLLTDFSMNTCIAQLESGR
nr:rRNA 2'-O-methyltransferase fibrillarin-like [Aedes albopictus]